MEQWKIARINELARYARERALTEDELQERAELRNEYLAAIRMSLTAQLDNTYVVEPDGTKRKLKRRDEQEER